MKMNDKTSKTVISGASAAFAFTQIGKLPRPNFAPDDGAGTGGAPAGDAGQGDAAASAGEGAGSGNADPGSLIGNATPGEGNGEGESVAEDQKPDGEKEEKGGEPDPLDAVPEDGKYDFSSLELPEGMEIDTELSEMAGPRMAEAKLSQNQANAVAGILTDMRKKQIEDWAKTNQDWQASVKSDKEIGGDNLKGSIQASETFLEQFGTQELRDYLISSGGGNHPEIIRAFARAGKALAEDNPGGKAGGDTPDAASILYPND